MSKAWDMLKAFFENSTQDLNISGCNVGSVYAKGENEFVDQLLPKLPGKQATSEDTSEQKYELDFADIDECVREIAKVKSWPNDVFLEMGINPVQVEFFSEFTFKIEELDKSRFEYPDWCYSKQSLMVWVGPKSKLFPFLVFPYEFGTPDQISSTSQLLDGLPMNPSIKNFRLCEKAKTKNTQKFTKPDKKQVEKIRSFV